MKAVAFVGPHNSGKTTLIKQIVEKLSRKRISVGIIKSTKHKKLFEDEGKDTTIFLHTPASKIAIVSPDKVSIFQKGCLPLEEIIAQMEHEIVICEGFKNSNLPKIAVFKEYNEEYWKNITNIVAVVSDSKVTSWNVPHFDFNQIEEITSFILKAIPSWADDNVKLYVNGREIEMKPFIQKILKDSILGFVKNLKGVESPESVKIEIKVTKQEF